MLHMAFSYKAKNIAYNSMLSYALTYSILLSPTSQRLAVHPLSPERETCCMLSFCRAFEFLPLYKRTFRFTPAIPLDCTVPRIRSGFLPTCEAQQDFTPTQKWRRHFCRQRTTFAAFTLSLQKGAAFGNFFLAFVFFTAFYKRI